MANAEQQEQEAAFDAVGSYCQDEINGFTNELIDTMLDLADLSKANRVLDCMAGDGNLTQRLLTYCGEKGIAAPAVVVLEYSRVQCEFARHRLDGRPVEVIRGDAVEMMDLDTGESIPDASFDRVLIKSGLHELPPDEQTRMFRSIWRILKPGGLFVNLGFVFEAKEERDEFREVTRVKDQLAGLGAAVTRRHFVTNEELETGLTGAGFTSLSGTPIQYRISSEVAGRYYFSRPGQEGAYAELQAAQARSLVLRRNKRIMFQADHSLMELPGLISVARKPDSENDAALFDRYPYLFLRKLECHRELLSEVVQAVPRGAKVLDLACGPGLLAERLQGRVARYVGVDLNGGFLEYARQLHRERTEFSFLQCDLNKFDEPAGKYDFVTLLNVLYMPAIQPIMVIGHAINSLQPGGCLAISGPSSIESFRRAAPAMRNQLERDGHLPAHDAIFRQITECNADLLREKGHYWSMEGMVALVQKLGCRQVELANPQIYYGQGFLVIARK